MVMGVVNNMSVDKSNKIDIEVKKIHADIKNANLALRVRMHDIQTELTEWDVLGGLEDGKSNGNGFMHKD